MVKRHGLVSLIVAAVDKWLQRNKDEKDDLAIKDAVRQLFITAHESGEGILGDGTKELAAGEFLQAELAALAHRADELPKAQRVATLRVMQQELLATLNRYRKHIDREVSSPRPI